MNLGNTWNNQSVREVQVAIDGTIVPGVLNGPKALLAILILLLGTEVVVKVVLQSVTRVDGGVGILNNLLQVGFIDSSHLITVGIILTIGLIEVDLGKECCTGSLRGAALLDLLNRQYGIGILEIVDDLLPALVVGILSV